VRLPLSGTAVVSRVITDLGVFDVTGDAFQVVELAPGVGCGDVVAKTAAAVIERAPAFA
jgi:3-oxoacid CoA-transferase subunit B